MQRKRTGNILLSSYENATAYSETCLHCRPRCPIEDCLQRLPDVDFHVAGGTPEDLAFWNQKCSSISNLKLHGYVAPGQTEAFRGAMDVLLAPTQPWVGAIQRLGKDDRLREALADRAYQDLATHHTWEQRAASVLQGIQERA